MKASDVSGKKAASDGTLILLPFVSWNVRYLRTNVDKKVLCETIISRQRTNIFKNSSQRKQRRKRNKINIYITFFIKRAKEETIRRAELQRLMEKLACLVLPALSITCPR